MVLKWIMKLSGVLVCSVSLALIGPIPLVESNETLESYSTQKYVTRHFVAPLKVATTKKDVECLAEAIYYEAANQTELGKEAVAMVIVNRVYNKRYPSTVCGVIKQSHIVKDKRICQFSYKCAEELHRPVWKVWKESKEIAERALINYWQKELLDMSLHKALYYHADYVTPEWMHQKVFVGQIGKHLFYADQPKLT